MALQILILAVGGTETVGKLPDGGRAFQDVPGWPISERCGGVYIYLMRCIVSGSVLSFLWFI